jgi:ABC-type uncharacterized transport system permease subunit
VYSSWALAHSQMHGYPGNCCMKYNTESEAMQAFYQDVEVHLPLLQPVDPPVLEDIEVHGSHLFRILFIVVITVVVVVVIGFLISKLL